MARLTSQPGGDELPLDLPLTGIVPVSQMIGEDEEETERLLQMESRARAFLSRFEWCASIRELYFGAGIGGIFAVFLAHITPSRPGIDEYLWVVVGDLPSAYLVMDAPPTPRDALLAYIEEMRKWVVLAKTGQASRDVIPVNVPATPEWAESLECRLTTLEKEIIPLCFES